MLNLPPKASLLGVADCSFQISSGNFKYNKKILAIQPVEAKRRSRISGPRLSKRSVDPAHRGPMKCNAYFIGVAPADGTGFQ